MSYMDELTALFTVDQFPRSATYDLNWTIENLMGPNVLWLTEYLCQSMDLQPGMRVLDMGCGKAVSSIFLAKEFGVQVWATDLWIPADENRTRIEQAGVESQVFPIHAEAHTLPFAHDFFDAAVSMDAYQYFGTDDLYLGYYSRFIKPGGQIGMVAPGLTHELGADVPGHLAPYWVWDFCCFHSPDWWRTHWTKTGLVDVHTADLMPDGAELWRRWDHLCRQAGARTGPGERELLEADAGRTLGFTRVVATRRTEPLYKV
jgi:cyclopropane fatty-acyl-phospholipid synthase-like methyltransferase